MDGARWSTRSGRWLRSTHAGNLAGGDRVHAGLPRRSTRRGDRLRRHRWAPRAPPLGESRPSELGLKVFRLTWASTHCTPGRLPLRPPPPWTTSLTDRGTAAGTTPLARPGSVVTNSRPLGRPSIKTDDQNFHRAPQWSLIPLDSNGRPQPDHARIITDCVRHLCLGPDTDANPRRSSAERFLPATKRRSATS